MSRRRVRFAARKRQDGADILTIRHTTRRLVAVGVILLCGMTAAHLFATRSTANRGEERRIALYNIHNKETIDIVYWRNGKRLPEAMKKLNWFLRDWRQNEPTTIDPELIDLVWELRTELGTEVPTHVISGYRSPKTNSMLRKTRGGQGRKSQHMLGRAMDIHFPDVPVKRLRYSAIVRERGGVGYYPTSAIPFVHVDTGRTRHWPRMPRYELALLFPDGKTRHVPTDGRRITHSDVKTARAKHKTLAVQIAQFHEFRRSPVAPRPTLIASGWGAQVRPDRPAAAPAEPARQVAKLAPRDAAPAGRIEGNSGEYRVASLGNEGLRPPAPRIAARPAARPITETPDDGQSGTAAPAGRPEAFATAGANGGPSTSDRMQLASLFALASLGGRGSQTGQPQERAAVTAAVGNEADETRQSRLGIDAPRPALPREAIDEAALSGWSNGFIAAPAFDEEHPDELFYRPFPLAPLLTDSSSADDPALAHMEHPDVVATLDLLDEESVTLPMRFTASQAIAAAMWTQQFSGAAINTEALGGARTPQPGEGTGGLTRRSVRTSMR